VTGPASLTASSSNNLPPGHGPEHTLHPEAPLTEPSTPTLVAFLAVVAFAALAPVVAWGRWAEGRWPAALGWLSLWLFLSGAPSALGLFQADNLVPRLPIFMVTMVVITTAVAFSSLGTRLAQTPLPWLVAYQGFRFPLELVLHAWVDEGVVPPQMTWTGPNVDILSGLICLGCAPLLGRFPRLAWLPATVGFVLLLNVIRVVIQSLPTPMQRYEEPVLLALSFPEVWIASVCVAGAWLVHLVTFRALWKARA